MSVAPALVLREGDRDRLGELARRPSVPSGLAKRAAMVLLAADGVPNAEIARRAGVSRPTVIGWRDRYRSGGIAALEDQPRSGRPAEIDEARVMVATLTDGGRPPERLGISYWSARVMAAEQGISFASVARIWRKWKIQPHQVGAFKFGTDPELEAEIRDVVGLYLAPPDHAVVVRVAEQSQGAVAGPPLQLWSDARCPHDGQRYGTGGACCQRYPHNEFLAFLKTVAGANADVDLHVVLDGNGAHRHPQVRRWLSRPENKRIAVHVTPAGCSWLTMVAIFYGITFRPGSERAARIGRVADAYDERCEPFIWMNDVG
jgi:transposase